MEIACIVSGDLEGVQRFKNGRNHRRYVGGMWEKIGELQFQFLLSKGLKPESYLLDVACGSFRLGRKAIPYLEAGHYLGIEKERELVNEGINKEIPDEIRKQKRPKIVISSSFEFEKLGQSSDMAIAQSLFTHLPKDLIELCFRKLYSALKDKAVFYATFRLTDKPQNKPRKDYGNFAYTRAEMCQFGTSIGFASNYIGNWGHPRGQVIVEYRKDA